MLSAPPALQFARAAPIGAVKTPLPLFDRTLEWPLVSLHADQLWSRGEGAGVEVAEVDTGIDPSQQDLADAVSGSVDLVGNSGNGAANEAHGTAVAGLIAGRGSPADPEQVAGLAPQAALIDIRVATRPDDVSPDEIADGIMQAFVAGARIINVSLASSTPNAQLRQAVAYVLARGCLVVASAGDTGMPEYPADYPGVLAVGEAGQNSHPLTSLTEFGAYAIYAPGTDLYSTAPPGRSGASAGYARHLQGSDYATAFVSAAAALLLSADPRLSPQDAGELLVQTARPTGGPSTAGSLDPLAALDRLSAPASPAHSSAERIILAVLLLAVVILLAFIAYRLYERWAGYAPTSWDEPW